MTEQPPPNGSEERAVPFDEWTDLDTLVHRTTITSGDFDYMLNPLCPECGSPLELIYDEPDGEAAVLGALVCDECAITYRPTEPAEQ